MNRLYYDDFIHWYYSFNGLRREQFFFFFYYYSSHITQEAVTTISLRFNLFYTISCQLFTLGVHIFCHSVNSPLSGTFPWLFYFDVAIWKQPIECHFLLLLGIWYSQYPIIASNTRQNIFGHILFSKVLSLLYVTVDVVRASHLWVNLDLIIFLIYSHFGSPR